MSQIYYHYQYSEKNFENTFDEYILFSLICIIQLLLNFCNRLKEKGTVFNVLYIFLKI